MANGKGGRPIKLKHQTVEELEADIDAYFESLWKTRKIKQRMQDGSSVEFEEDYMRPPTMAGLARHLGVVRATLWHMTRRPASEDVYKPAVARALTRIAEYAEEALYTREGGNGAKFALEVNHRYGREDEDATAGAGFSQTIIAPTIESSEAPLAIPRWNEGSDDE